MTWTPAALDALAAELPVSADAPAMALREDSAGTLQLDLDGVVGWDITAAAVRRALAEAGTRDLTVRINSYGGSVFEGFAIYNQLARHKGKVTVLVDAIAASAASVIAMAGAEIVMPRASFLMIHNAWTISLGDHREMERTAKLLERLSGAIAAIYAARTGRDQAAMQTMMDEETWLGAEDAIAEGFANRIEGDAAAKAPQGKALDVVAGFRRVPEALRALIPASARPGAPLNLLATPAPKEDRMTRDNPQTPPATGGQTPPAVVAATIEQLEALAARSRGSLDAQWVLTQAKAGITIEAARDLAIDAMAAAQPQRGPIAHVITDQRDTFVAHASEAIQARFAQATPSAAAREYYAMGLHGLLRECLAMAGVAGVHRLNGEALYERLRAEHTTSDFPLILKDAANKRLMAKFAEYPATWRVWADEIDVADFKSINIADIGGFPKMKPKPEGMEVRYGAVSEDGFSYNLVTQSSGVVLSREAIINDDLAAFGRMLNDAASVGYAAVADAVYGQITSNPTMQDGVALFHASHGNLLTGSTLDEDNLGKAEAALIDQTDMNGDAIAPPVRLVLLVPSSRNIAARKLATVVTPDSQQNVGVFGGRITPVVEPRLKATNSPWYLVTPDRPTVEVAYLQGRRVPQMSSMEDFDTLGMKYRLIFDMAAKAISWRGMVKNPGAAS